MCCDVLPPFLPVSSGTPPPIFLRLCGGQPVNSNALRHDFFAVRNPTPLTLLRLTIASRRHIPLSLPGVYEQVIWELRVNLEQAFISFMRVETISGKVTAMNRLGKLASGMDKISGVWYKQIQPRRDLLGVASRIPVAVRFHFRRHDITRDSYSFRDFFEKSDFNSHIFNDSPAGTQSES